MEDVIGPSLCLGAPITGNRASAATEDAITALGLIPPSIYADLATSDVHMGQRTAFTGMLLAQ